jgi:O-antigen ligase
MTWIILGLIAGGFLWAERRAWMLLIVLMPLFGNRPASDQAAMLLVVSCTVQLVIAPRIWRMLPETPLHQSLLWSLVTLYAAVSCLSLSGIPLADWLAQARAQVPALSEIEVVAFQIAAATRAPENQLWYGVLSVQWTLLAWTVALRLFQLIHRAGMSAGQFWATVQCSLLLSLTAGLLDYYGLIDLARWRALDPVVNPGDVHFRLQSWFGHSGWYAEFITLTAPSTLVWLLLRSCFRRRVAAILLTLVLGEFVLILTFQRGGWLAYPMTLLAVWAAVHAWRSIETRQEDSTSEHPAPRPLWPALRGAGWKVALSLPLTLFASILIVALARSAAPESSGDTVLSQYVSRARDITRAGDRTAFIHAGFLLGTRAPLLGGGSELFAYHYQREVMDPAGAFSGRFNLPLYGSAHNVYAQTFAGKGILGLGLLLLVLGALILVPLRRFVRARSESPETQILLLAASATGVAFLIYGNVQEVFYIQPLQILFFAVIGVTAGLLLKSSPAAPTSMRIPLTLVGAAMVAQLVIVNGVWGVRNESSLEQRSVGCYPPEVDAEGRSFQWCGPRARIVLPAESEQIEIEAAPTFRGDTVKSLQLWKQGVLIDEFPLSPGERRSVALDAIPSLHQEPQLPRKGHAHYQTLELRYGRCLVPGLEMRQDPARSSDASALDRDPVTLSREMRASPLLSSLAPQVPQGYAKDTRCLAFKIRF